MMALDGQVAAAITVSVASVLGGVWLIVRGFHGAGDAIERVLAGSRRWWFAAGAWTACALLGAGIASGIVTYWISALG